MGEVLAEKARWAAGAAAAHPAAAPREPAWGDQRPDGKRFQYWDVPTDTETLREILTYALTNHWRDIEYGAKLAEATYELAFSQQPICEFKDGEFTIELGGGPHIHVSLADAQMPWGQVKKPTQARFYRLLDKDGAPLTWGFETLNANGDKPIIVRFPTPFRDGMTRLAEPRWHRLYVWEDMARRYLNREPEGFDRSGKGAW